MRQQETSAKHPVIAFALVGTASFAAPGRAQMDTPAVPPASAAVSVNAALVEDITRLWKASLSEEFIRKYVAHADLARDLTAEDIVRLRCAGVPETLIASITRRHTESCRRAWPGSPRGLPTLGRLTRRNSGIVISRAAGTREFSSSRTRRSGGWTPRTPGRTSSSPRRR